MFTRINSSPLSPPPVQNHNQKSVFKPSHPQTNSSDEFKPFVPNYKVNTQTRGSNADSNSQNNKNLHSSPSNYDKNYSYFTIGQSAKGPEQKEKVTLQPAFSNIVTKQETVKEYNSPNNSSRTVTSHEHTTETVTKSHPKTETSTAESVGSDYDAEEAQNPKGEEEEISEEESSSDIDEEDEEEHFNPPPEFFRTESRYENIRNPFADPDFDFDKFLDKLRGPTTKPPKVKIIPKSQQGANRGAEKEISPSKSVAVLATRVPVPFTKKNGKNAPELNIAPVQFYGVNTNPRSPSGFNRAPPQPLQPLPPLQSLPQLQQRQPLPQLQPLASLAQLQQLPPLKQLPPLQPLKPLNTVHQLKPLQSVQPVSIVNEYYQKNTAKSPLYVNSESNINVKVRHPLPEVNKYYESNGARLVHDPHDLVKTSSIQSRPIVNVYYEKTNSKPTIPVYYDISTVQPPPASTIRPQIIIKPYEKSPKPPQKEYYYEYEDVTQKPKRMYSSQITTTVKKENKVTVKKPSVEYEYYYDDDDEYEHPKNKQKQSTKNNSGNSGGEVKYSARYQEKPPQIEKNPNSITNTPEFLPNNKNVDSYDSHTIYANFLTTTPKSFNTARQRKRPSTRPVVSSTTTTTTTKSPRGKSKQRHPTRYDLDIKREQVSKR